MLDLDEQLRRYVDDLADNIERDADRSDDRPTGRRARRLLLVLCSVLVAVLVLGAALALMSDEDETTVAGTEVVQGEWRALPTELFAPDLSPAVFWTGRELVTIYGGDDHVVGQTYRPADDSVRQIAASPLEWRANAAVAWTGREILIAGGSNGPGIDHAGAAYDPSTDTWRPLPDPPGFVAGRSDNHVAGPAVWSGVEMVAWQSGLAFGPDTGKWREIARSPLAARTHEAVAAIDGRVFVWGGCSQSTPNCDEVATGDARDELTDGAVYDPTTDTWAMVSPSPLVAGDHPTATWTGEEVVVGVHAPAGTGTAYAAYDPETATWRSLPAPPVPLGSRYVAAVWTGRSVVYTGGNSADAPAVTGATAALDPATGSWMTLPDGPARRSHVAAWTGTDIIVTGGHPRSRPWTLRLSAAAVDDQAGSSPAATQCPGSVVRRVDGGSPDADALPPVEAAVTDRSVAATFVASDTERLLEQYDAERVAVGAGFGRAWKGENGGRFELVDVDDYGIEIVLSSADACPTDGSLHVMTYEGLPLFFFIEE